MTYVLLSVVLLLLSPILQKRTIRIHRLHQLVQGLLVIGVSFYALYHVLPVAFKQIGWMVVPALIAGFGLIWVTERFWMSSNRGVYFLLLMTAIVGIILHSLTDGAMIAFSMVQDSEVYHLTGRALLILVFIHQLPVGAFVWSIAAKKLGESAAWIIIVAMSFATIIGYLASHQIAYSVLYRPEFGYFQAFVVGSLIHIGFEPFVHGKRHACDC